LTDWSRPYPWLLVGAVGMVGAALVVVLVRRARRAGSTRTLDDLANQAEVTHDPIDQILLPDGPPTDATDRAQLLEQYKLMVQTSEALVARRQGTNTFFLTANGVLLTALGLFVRQGADPRRHSAVIAIFCLTGLIISWAWRSLLISFGQLNKGKFAVILRMEKRLVASIFDAEWEALGRGSDPKVYRSFTESESRVPMIFMSIYVLAAAIAGLVAAGWVP
jgi:hypothetical protein